MNNHMAKPVIQAWIDSLPELVERNSEPAPKKRKLHHGHRTEDDAVQQPSPALTPTSDDEDDEPRRIMPSTPPTTRKRPRECADGDDEVEFGNTAATPRASASIGYKEGHPSSNLLRQQSLPSRSTTSASRSASHRSRSSSPIKHQLARLRLRQTAPIHQIDIERPANEAVGLLLQRLEQVNKSNNILPASHRATILESPVLRGTPLARWQGAFTHEVPVTLGSQHGEQLHQGTDLPGRIPAPEEIGIVTRLAGRCSSKQAEEAAWNFEVHYRLLETVFRERETEKAVGPFEIMTCTTARPDPRWLPSGASGNKVDFCLYATLQESQPSLSSSSASFSASSPLPPNLPPSDAAVHEAKIRLCERLESMTVNHTTYMPLQLDPIMLSIETKRQDADSVKAELQMTVWHAVQWAFLREAVRTGVVERLLSKARGERERQRKGQSLQGQQRGIGSNDAATADQADASMISSAESALLPVTAAAGEQRSNTTAPEMCTDPQADEQAFDAVVEAETESILSKLPFLPGILIFGHRWLFVFSTWHGSGVGQGSHFWRECQFGSTLNILEAYQVVAGLREIAGWVERVYIPWFRRWVLCVDGEMNDIE